jgi:hypothetical protein
LGLQRTLLLLSSIDIGNEIIAVVEINSGSYFYVSPVLPIGEGNLLLS